MALIQLISYTLIIIFIITIIQHNIKECDTFLEKFLLITIGSIIITLPYFIYVTDYFNIPSLLIELGVLKNVNIEFWKDFTSSYISTIAGTILSGGIVLCITKIQLDRTKSDNQEALNEEKRISNFPYMQYKFKNIKLSTEKTTTINIPQNKKNNNINDEITLTIKNIGMNAAKKCKIKLKGEGTSSLDTYNTIDTQSILPQNEEIQIIFKIKNCIEKNYQYKIIFYYQDLLSNQYKQIIHLKYNLKFNDKSISHENLEINIEDEELLTNDKKQIERIL